MTRTARVGNEGQITWEHLLFIPLQQALTGKIIILNPEGDELNRHDSEGVIRAALRSLIKKQGGQSVVAASAILKEANKHAAEHFRKAIADYILVTSLSVTALPARRIRIGNCRIMQLDSRDRYPYPTTLQHEGLPERGWTSGGPQHYQLVGVTTSGRSTYEAAHRAFDALSLLRGLWNLFITYGSWHLWGGRQERRPIGAIQVGPIYTLHNLDGTLPEDLHWYEPDFVEQPKAFTPQKGWALIEKNRRWAIRRIRNLPFGEDVRRLIIRYAAALGSADMDVAFLQMWSILEHVTDTVGKSYEETVRRATWIFSDREWSRELLEYLRCYRNQYVHAARSEGRGDQAAQMIKSFIEPHLIRLLRNDFGIETIKEYAACLGLPYSVEGLKKHRRVVTRVLRLRTRRSESE